MLMVFGEEAGLDVAGLVQPVLEADQAFFDAPGQFFGKALRATMGHQHADQRGDDEISAVQPGIDAGKGLIHDMPADGRHGAVCGGQLH